MIRLATHNDIEVVTAIYDHIHKMEAEGLVRIGWNPSVYPVRTTAEEAIQRGDLFVFEQEGIIMASAIINRTQVPVYATGQWAFPAADDEVMVLHTLTVDPACGGRGIGRQFVHFMRTTPCARAAPFCGSTPMPLTASITSLIQI